MARETKDGKAPRAKEVKAEAPAEIAPVMLNAPAFDSEMKPPPDWLMPCTFSVAAVFVRLRLPPVVLVALKFPTVVTDGEGGGPEFENSHWTDR